MKIALLNPWRDAAENQLVPGISRVAEALGHQVVECKTSQDVEDQQPDFVLSMSRTQPKLTDVPTYGLIFDPRHILLERPSYLQSILSYDGVFTIFETLQQFLSDLMFAARRDAAIGEFYPTAPVVAWDRPIAFDEAHLAYFGINWDRRRHGLFALLGEEPWMDLYGPEHGWAHLTGSRYKGMVPFDGISVLERYRQAGAGLCLFSDSHFSDNIITSRVFEICAAGALVVAPRMPWLAENFGDSILYFDQGASDREIHDQLQQHMLWIRAHPTEAEALAARSHQIFTSRFSLEVLLPNVISFHERIVASPRAVPEQGTVSIVVSWPDRSADTLKRSLASLARQEYPSIEPIVAVATEADARSAAQIVDEMTEQLACRIVVAPSAAREAVLGSSVLWSGLRACQGEYVAVLPSGDEWMSGHITSLVQALAGEEAANLAFSSSIVHHDQEFVARGGHVERRRMLLFPFVQSRHDVVQDALEIPVAAAMFRRSLLDRWVLEDPGLQSCQDAYLILSLLAKEAPVFTYRPTALHYEVGEAWLRKANPSFAEDITRLRLRFVGRTFPPARRVADLGALQRIVERGETRRQQEVGEVWRQNGVVHYRVPATFEYLFGTEDTWEPVAVPLAPDDLELSDATRPSGDGDVLPLLVTSPDQPWAHGLRWRIAFPEDRPYVVRLDCRVEAGTAGFGVLAGQQRHFAYRVFVPSQEGQVIVDLPISDPTLAAAVVVQSTAISRSVRVLVNKIQVLAATPQFPIDAVKHLLRESEQFRVAQATVQQELWDENEVLRASLLAAQRSQEAVDAQLAATAALLDRAEALQTAQATAYEEMRQELERMRARTLPAGDDADA